MASISVAMGTYNGASFLPEQLESLLIQDQAPVELVVGDDGSTDETLAILRDFAGRAPFPVRITRNAKQLGYGENFLQAASRCTGDWVAFCDQDDVWLPSKLSRCAAAIASAPPDLGLVIHGAIVGDAHLDEITRTTWPRPGLYDRMRLPPSLLVQGFRQVIRRSLLDEVPFKERHIPWIGEPEAHDAWVCLIGLVTGSIAVLGDHLVIYRRHEANTTEVVGLTRKTLVQRIRGKVQDNSEQYKEQAGLYETIANYLKAQASNQTSAERNDQFLSASRQVEVIAAWFATRAQINGDSSLGQRLRSYASLTSSGAYSPKHGLGARRAEAAIDLIRVLFPRL